jgi:UDP-N-acetyl-D-mannosaminuronate dehydrogenase
MRFEGASLRSVPLTPEVVAAADCVVITTAHTHVDYDLVFRDASLIVDTRNALKGRESEKIHRL